MKGRMKTKRTKVKRPSKLLLQLYGYGSYLDEARQLETLLARKPRRLHIEMTGLGRTAGRYRAVNEIDIAQAFASHPRRHQRAIQPPG